ncbi:MAG: methyltransferase domain-containing protein [Balneolaceae bacterium]|nr:methyltransferase domain-containing protein [Balneolaceae bacterium]
MSQAGTSKSSTPSSSHTTTEKHNEEIARSFGDAVAYYEQNARVQKEVSERLIASLDPWRDIIPPGPILEIGCGTGFVTEGILNLYPGRKKIITDLSPVMVEYCREKFNGAEHVTFEQLDAENVDPDEPQYALTVSGFAAQWFRDPAFTLGRLMEATLPGGLLLASFPGSESFPEWKEQCNELGLPFTGNTLPDTEEMVIKMSTGPTQVDYYEDTITQKFESAADFFRHLKQIGAGTKKEGRSLTPGEMRMLINHWNRTADDGIKVSYHVVFLAVKRDHVS